MTKISGITGFILIFSVQTAFPQSYDHYFLNRVKADSLVTSGNYIAAIPHLKVCVSEWEMVTVNDEFRLGYAFFKQNKIDSAAMFLNKALTLHAKDRSLILRIHH